MGAKIPKDVRESLEDKAGHKLEWIKKRLIDICVGVENVARWDNLQQDFVEKVSDVSRKYPKANYTALLKIIGNTPGPKPSLDEAIKVS